MKNKIDEILDFFHNTESSILYIDGNEISFKIVAIGTSVINSYPETIELEITGCILGPVDLMNPIHFFLHKPIKIDYEGKKIDCLLESFSVTTNVIDPTHFDYSQPAFLNEVERVNLSIFVPNIYKIEIKKPEVEHSYIFTKFDFLDFD